MRRGLLGGNLDAVGELHTLDHLWQLIVAVEARQLFCAASTSLKTMASAVLFERHLGKHGP